MLTVKKKNIGNLFWKCFKNVDLRNSNLCKNADGLFATKTHDKSDFYGLEVVEYLGEFALSY